jgi:hypothetical protein
MPAVNVARVIPKAERETHCWNDCGRPRAIIFPTYGGSLLSIYCKECQRATRVLAHLQREREQMETQQR